MRRRSPEVALRHVVVDCLLQHPRCIFWVYLAVRFERFNEGVRGVVRLVEVLGLNLGGALEGLAGFFACFKEAY